LESWEPSQHLLIDTGNHAEFLLLVWHAFLSGRQGLSRQREVLLDQEMNEA